MKYGKYDFKIQEIGKITMNADRYYANDLYMGIKMDIKCVAKVNGKECVLNTGGYQRSFDFAHKESKAERLNHDLSFCEEKCTTREKARVNHAVSRVVDNGTLLDIKTEMLRCIVLCREHHDLFDKVLPNTTGKLQQSRIRQRHMTQSYQSLYDALDFEHTIDLKNNSVDKMNREIINLYFEYWSGQELDTEISLVGHSILRTEQGTFALKCDEKMFDEIQSLFWKGWDEKDNCPYSECKHEIKSRRGMLKHAQEKHGGATISEIHDMFGLARPTISKYLGLDKLPENANRRLVSTRKNRDTRGRIYA